MTGLAMGRVGRILCLAAAMLGSGVPARADCALQQRTVVPLTIARGQLLVPVEVNGDTPFFLLDTGAQRSMVTEAAVQSLHLARDPWVGTTMSGIGGINRRANADPRSFSLGGIPLVRRTVTHDTSLTVGILANAGATPPVVAGLLGRDYLSQFDLDLDVPARRLTLYQPVGCSGRFLPWTGPYAATAVTLPDESALVVPVTLDGVPLRALLDTGASNTLLAAPGMYRLGLGVASLGSDPAVQVSGAGSHIVSMHLRRFHSLQVGGQTIDDPVLLVAPTRLFPIVDMLLGADWLAQRRIWISYATKQLFVAPHAP